MMDAKNQTKWGDFGNRTLASYDTGLMMMEPEIRAYVELAVDAYEAMRELVEAVDALFDGLEEAQSTSDTLAAIDDALPDLRAAFAKVKGEQGHD